MLLKKPTDIPGLGFAVWDPRQNVSDRFHLMPIITPAYPQQVIRFEFTLSTVAYSMTFFMKNNYSHELFNFRTLRLMFQNLR